MLCRLLIVLMAWMPFHVAQAGVISTDQAVASAQSDRAAVLSLISRSDVASQLQALGLDPATAKDRVAALTDQEVSTLAGKLQAVPAGADGGGWVLLIIIIALVWYFWK
ncbi:MAG TPA: PA2779 family protein [Burkholderiales bacterium]|nr:PA2779 family protein [Burkholderiales bacterium]